MPKSLDTLEITPSEIIFKDVTPGQIYQMKVLVKNHTQHVRRIRVFQPRTPEFRCDYEMAMAIAPGLFIELIISFEATTRDEFKDEITVISDDFEYLVPMKAFSPIAKIVFEPFINFGFIQIGGQKKERVVFKNEGNESGTVNLQIPENDGIKILPRPNFVLEPGAMTTVELVYTATESGIYRGAIEVKSSGKLFVDSIDVNATCVDYMQFIIDKEGKEMMNVQFGEVLFGQTVKKSGFLVNNSPEKLKFNSSYLQGHFDQFSEENNLRSPHEVGLEQTQKILSIEPSEGLVESYSQIPITFVCKTNVDIDQKIFTSNFCLEKDQKSDKRKTKEYKYTAVFFFQKYGVAVEGEQITKSLKMIALGTCPRVILSEGGL